MRSARTAFAPALSRLALALALSLGASCARRTEVAPELEVVEVDAGATAHMTADGDATEPERGPSLSGALPSSFPRDLPLPLPASVTELSSEADAARFVVIRSAAAPETLRRELASRLDRGGWQREGGDPWVRTKDGRRVQLRIDPDAFGGGTLMRVEY
jgi:hypothetical protein